MKVLLLSLPGLGENDGNLFPLGIGYLAASLKQYHDVEAYHYNSMNLVVQDVRKKLCEYKPDLVGLTCSTFNRAFVKKMIGIIKAFDHNVNLVVGGVHVSFLYDQVLKQYGADFVVIGEGERTIVELCDAIEKKSH